MFHGFATRKIVPRPVIRRTRSWRGNMRTRKDKSDFFARENLVENFIIGPAAFIISGTLGLLLVYWLFGHDRFFQELYGHESESSYERRVNPIFTGNPNAPATLRERFTHFYSRLERPRYKQPELDVFRRENTEKRYRLALKHEFKVNHFEQE